jgi:heat shock protein HtpX
MKARLRKPESHPAILSGIMRNTSFGRDTGLQARMLLTMFLLGAVYVVLIGVLIAAGASGVTIIVIAGGLFLLQAFTSEKLALRAMGAREVSPQEAPELHAMIERLCIQADLPKPRVAVAQNRMPNAFAMGIRKKDSVVCATTGIMELLSPAELEGVMAHELSHIANRDVAVMTMASFFASIASMVVQFGFLFGGGGFGGSSDNDDDGPGALVIILVSLGVYVLSFILMQALSRYREYAADRGSAVITGRPSALSSALLKISGTMERIPQQDLRRSEMAAFYIFPPGAKAAVGNIFSTHPPLEKRIAALSRLEAQLQAGGGRGLAVPA